MNENIIHEIFEEVKKTFPSYDWNCDPIIEDIYGNDSVLSVEDVIDAENYNKKIKIFDPSIDIELEILFEADEESYSLVYTDYEGNIRTIILEKD